MQILKTFMEFRRASLPGVMQAFGRVVDRAGLMHNDKTVMIMRTIVWATLKVCQVGRRTDVT